MIRHVRQDDPMGCAVACLAMVLCLEYAQARAMVGAPGSGFTYHVWQEIVQRHGMAIQHLWRYDPLVNKPRDPWPLPPWAPVHIACVDAGLGDGTHTVVMLKDGTTLDPMRDKPGRLSDYPSVAYIAGLFEVAGNERRHQLFANAASRLDMAASLIEDERVCKRLDEARDAIRAEIAGQSWLKPSSRR